MSLRKVVIDWLLRDTRNHDGSSWKMQARNPRQSFCPQEAWRPQLLRKEPPIVCAVAHQMSVENQLRLARDSHGAISVFTLAHISRWAVPSRSNATNAKWRAHER